MSGLRARLTALCFGPLFGLAACGPTAETPPRVASAASPFDYPVAQWDAGIEGEVVLMVHVEADGHADTAFINTSSGVPALDSAALADVGRLLFAPARHDGERVEMWARLPVRYRMDGAPDPTTAAAPGERTQQPDSTSSSNSISTSSS